MAADDKVCSANTEARPMQQSLMLHTKDCQQARERRRPATLGGHNHLYDFSQPYETISSKALNRLMLHSDSFAQWGAEASNHSRVSRILSTLRSLKKPRAQAQAHICKAVSSSWTQGQSG
jgi:hypothetical protein